jgi:hypothetical protein
MLAQNEEGESWNCDPIQKVSPSAGISWFIIAAFLKRKFVFSLRKAKGKNG